MDAASAFSQIFKAGLRLVGATVVGAALFHVYTKIHDERVGENANGEHTLENTNSPFLRTGC